MTVPKFHELKEKFPEAPPDAIFGALFVMRVRETEGADYPEYAALGRYAIAQDIILSGEEQAWAHRILGEAAQ